MDVFRDFRYALRTLRKSPGFTLTAIAVLALGIGANTAIFSVVYAVILRPLPYPDASRLVFVWQTFPNVPPPFRDHMFVARENYAEWRRQNTVFQQMEAFRNIPTNEAANDSNGKVATTYASPGLFRLLGVQPRLGRLFRAEEAHAGRNHVAILSDAYFERRFHRDAKALGKSLTLDETAYTVIGTLPANFYMPRTVFDDSQPDVFVPMPVEPSSSSDLLQVEVVARLRPGVTLARARTEMAGIAMRQQKDLKPDAALYKLGSAAIFPFRTEATNPDLNRGLYLLLAAVSLVLLIACANLANLTLARATLRSREIMVRLALGATRGRVLAQLLTESLLVSLAGAAGGVLLADWSIRLMLALKPPDIERPELIAINLPVLAFATAAAVLTAVLFGLGPALAVSGADLAPRLRAGGWGSSAARLRGRQFLIACEVALAVMLLAGTGLMIRSLQQIASVGVGFDTSRLAALDINFPEKRYPDAAVRAGILRELIARTRSIPGVADAALISNLPFHSVGMSVFHIAGRVEPTRDSAPVADRARVSPGFLQMIGVRLEAGRWLTEADLTPGPAGQGVALVNRAFALKYFPGESPLGHGLSSGDNEEHYQIVGVVADYRAMGAEGGVRPQIFQPRLDYDATLVARSRGTPESIEHSLLATARSVAPGIATDKVKSVAEYADYWTSQRKFNTLLLEIFAGLALVLAMLGIYGVLSNLVTSRVREIGIRMAVGATPGSIVKLVLRQSMIPVAIGLCAGLAGCLALGRLVQSLLFQVQARDPLTLAAAAAFILLTSPAALYLPLRRATAIDCSVALREE